MVQGDDVQGSRKIICLLEDKNSEIFPLTIADCR